MNHASDYGYSIEGQLPAAEKRSTRAIVRNPVLALPAIAELRALPEAARAPLVGLLRELGTVPAPEPTRPGRPTNPRWPPIGRRSRCMPAT